MEAFYLFFLSIADIFVLALSPLRPVGGGGVWVLTEMIVDILFEADFVEYLDDCFLRGFVIH